MKGMLKKFAEMQASDGCCLSVRVVGSWGGKSPVYSVLYARVASRTPSKFVARRRSPLLTRHIAPLSPLDASWRLHGGGIRHATAF